MDTPSRAQVHDFHQADEIPLNGVDDACYQGDYDYDPNKGLLLSEEEDGKQRFGVLLSTFRLCTAIIGPALLAIPYALQVSGYAVGVILIILLATIADYSVVLLVRAGQLTDSTTLSGIMHDTYGNIGYGLVTVLSLCQSILWMMIYNTVIADNVTTLALRMGAAESVPLMGRREFLLLLVTLVITLPLCLFRTTNRLSRWQVMSVGFVAVTVVLIVVKLSMLDIPATSDAFSTVNIGVTSLIGIVACVFSCHDHAFEVCETLEEGTNKRWALVTHCAVFSSLVVAFLVGLLGYSTFTGLVQGNLLENYCLNDDIMNAGRFSFTIYIVCNFSTFAYRGREVLETDVLALHLVESTSRRVIATVCIVLISLGFTFSTTCLGPLLEFTGLTCVVPLYYIMPALAMLRVQEGSVFSWRKLPTFLLAAFGILLTISGLVIWAYRVTVHPGCSHGYQMAYCHDYQQEMAELAEDLNETLVSWLSDGVTIR